MATMMREYVTDERTAPPDPVLEARAVIPVLPRHHVDRPRLHAMLDEGAERPLTLVSAAAGSGKTTVGASWALERQRRRPDERLGWVTFEPGDERPDILWPLVLASLRRCGVAPPVAAYGDSVLMHRDMVSDVGVCLAGLDTPLVLVLDGYEIADAELATDLAFLLSHSAGQLRLILLTRADPTLPLHRFRLSEAITEVRMADLAFTSAETRRLVHAAPTQFAESSVEALLERTRGWAAGLRFALWWVDRSSDPVAAISRLRGDTGNVAQYLRTEMLDTLPTESRELLLRTSVVEVLQPGLIEELGGPAAARALASLSRSNLLLDEVGDAPGWFEYHPLLRDLLRAELADTSPSRLSSLQRQAEGWYAGAVQEPAVPGLRAVGARAPSPALASGAAAFRLPDGCVIEPLSAKEREVLGHLAELLSTEEIAATMFVSVNTVRTHVRNLLRKLAVNRRNDAIRRARSLNLIEPPA